jgi:GNAT superfamily N-acetyltransferase
LKSELTVREMLSSDTDDVLRLLEICMPNSPIPRKKDFWEWKHFKNPFGASPGLLAFSNTKLVGLRIFMRWAWTSGSNEVPAVRAVDTATHPDWRGQRIFQNLTRSLLQQMESRGVSFVYNTPNRFSLPGYLRMGWQTVSKVPLWMKPVRPFRMIRELSRKKTDPWVIQENSESIVQSLAQSDSPEYFENSGETRYHTARTIGYFRWRYNDIPHFSYYAKFKKDGNASALLIFRKRIRKSFRELSISEMLMSPNKDGIALAAKLLKEIAAESGAHYMIATAATGTEQLKVLQSCNFLPVGKRGPLFTVRVLNQPAGPDPLMWSSWRCSIGDLELF